MNIDKIGIFALSNLPDSEQLKIGMSQLRNWGFSLTLANSVFDESFRRMAGNDKSRAAGFNALLADGEINLMMAARGGYGVTRCLDDLDWELLLRRNVPIVGYSDVTALLLAAYSKGYENGIVGPMLCSQFALPDFNMRNAARQNLEKALSGDSPSFNECKVIKHGHVRGPVIPMNLTLMDTLLGTAYMPDLTGCILVLEDISEPAHSVDRRLNHLKMCGVLSQISGLVFGQFTNCEDDEYLPEIFRDFSQCVHGPVLTDLGFGHVNPSLAIRFGQIVDIDVV